VGLEAMADLNDLTLVPKPGRISESPEKLEGCRILGLNPKYSD
jgi:hypothetical protein